MNQSTPIRSIHRLVDQSTGLSIDSWLLPIDGRVCRSNHGFFDQFTRLSMDAQLLSIYSRVCRSNRCRSIHVDRLPFSFFDQIHTLPHFPLELRWTFTLSPLPLRPPNEEFLAPVVVFGEIRLNLLQSFPLRLR